MSYPGFQFYPRKAWIIWLLATAFYLYEFLLQVSPSVMVTELKTEFGLNGVELGTLSAFYFYGYAGMQLPVGILVDRFRPRRLLTIATLVCAAGCFAFAVAEHLWLAQLGRFLIGFGGAFAWVSSLAIAIIWFPAPRFALMNGVLLTTGTIGAIFGEAPLAHFVDYIGWRTSLMYLAFAGVGLAGLIAWQVHDFLPHETDKPTPPIRHHLLTELLTVMKKPQSWLAAIYAALMFGPTSIFGALWGVPFLRSTYGFDKPTAAAFVSLLFIGLAFGSPLFGWYSNYINRRLRPLWIAAFGALIVSVCTLYIPNLPGLVLGALLFLFGFFSGGFLPSFSVIKENHPMQVHATALAFVNMFSMVGGTFGQPLIGAILDKLGEPTTEHLYQPESFRTAMLVIPISFLLSLVILPFIKETWCKPRV